MNTTIQKYQDIIDINEKMHIKYVIENIGDNGWGEEIKSKDTNPPAVQVTSQMIIGLSSFLDILDDEDIKSNIRRSIQESISLLLQSFQDNGWSDYSGDHVIVDATGAATLAILNAVKYNIVKSDNLPIQKAISFLCNQQNEDGGWSIHKGGESKIYYLYWALKALLTYCSLNFNCQEDNVQEYVDKGKEWLLNNFADNENKCFSLKSKSGFNVIATAFGIELLLEMGVEFNKNIVYRKILDEQRSRGEWTIDADQTTVDPIPRRVYILADMPKISECLLYLDIPLNNHLFKNVLHRIKELEIRDGGFKHGKNETFASGWFTAQALKMLSLFLKEYYNHPEHYEIIPPGYIRKYSFSKGVLMIGRYRPPHIGHYNGLKAILYGDENEFSLPADTLRGLIDIDKVIIGIARYDLSPENPFTTGQVREIWKQIIDNDSEIKDRNNIIEIVSCPADKDMTNILDAVNEITYKQDSITVITGNDRVIEQCKACNISCYKFKRDANSISGTKIRELISKVDFDNPSNYQSEIAVLKTYLHPITFHILNNDGLLKQAHGIINAK